MKVSNLCIIAVFFMAIDLLGTDNASDFFTIKSVKFFGKPPPKGFILYKEITKPDKTEGKIFLPFLKVSVRTQEQIKYDSLYAKAYYYDMSRKLVGKNEAPYPVERDDGKPYPMPVFFSRKSAEILYFAVPEKVLELSKWQVVVVFGDKDAATAKVYPGTDSVTQFDFPERQQVDAPNQVKRIPTLDPVIEHIVKTSNEKQPQITLFMRPPIGMTDISEANGVLAMCLLANNVGEIKRRLQELETKDDVGGVLRFAERHKLVVLCWGSRSLWDPSASWDEQSKVINQQMDATFDVVAKAWVRGVKELSKKYGMPDNNFLLWGCSGSAQYAMRLALRQPKFFLAIHIHIPSSFDKPTPEANRVLWCLTTGENEGGYERSLRFLSACRKLGYPIIYKSIIGLGHSDHPAAERLGLVFFEYALSLRKEKSELGTEMKNTPWPESFRNPEFIGDVVNQKILQFDRAYVVPSEFQIILPTQELAEAWNCDE